jgi:hypothetical protein
MTHRDRFFTYRARSTREPESSYLSHLLLPDNEVDDNGEEKRQQEHADGERRDEEHHGIDRTRHLRYPLRSKDNDLFAEGCIAASTCRREIIERLPYRLIKIGDDVIRGHVEPDRILAADGVDDVGIGGHDLYFIDQGEHVLPEHLPDPGKDIIAIYQNIGRGLPTGPDDQGFQALIPETLDPGEGRDDLG